MKKLGFGFMRLPLKTQEDQESVDFDTINKMVDSFLEQGFNYFDTAYMYHMGKSEIAVREALVKRYKREDFLLASKLPIMPVFINKEGDQERIFDEQLEKCGVDYFDNYLIHNLGEENYANALKFDSFNFVLQKKKEGKIKRVGFSFHDSADLLDKILTAHPEMEFVQLQINYLDWENPGVQSRKCYEVARKHGKPVIVMEPVKGGLLANLPEEADKILKEYNSDLSNASWAIRYAASLEGVEVVLSGMSDFEQLKDNTSYMKDFKPLNKEELKLTAKVADILNQSIAIPCTDCQYCMSSCPKNIAIPQYFALYNNLHQSLKGIFAIQKVYYDNFSKTYGKASDCIECRKCEKECPQHIEISKELKDVAQKFEVDLSY